MSCLSNRSAGLAKTRWITPACLGVAQSGEAKQGTDRSQPKIAGAGAVSPDVLEVTRNAAIRSASGSVHSGREGALRMRSCVNSTSSRRVTVGRVGSWTDLTFLGVKRSFG